MLGFCGNHSRNSSAVIISIGEEHTKMKYKVFVDGQEGTTGLQINERLAGRDDIEVLSIDAQLRKETQARAEMINAADVVFLCLPDDAARESVSLVKNENTRIIDASTAHRTAIGWEYGIPEFHGQRERIAASKRVSVPGCYATGFNMLLYPLVQEGIVSRDYPLSVHALSGYSGGGKKLIGKFEDPDNATRYASPSMYALGLSHKHIPEMTQICQLHYAPIFAPMVCNYYQGMSVAVPLHRRLLSKDISGEQIQAYLTQYYHGEEFVSVIPYDSSSYLDEGFLMATACNGTNRIELYVFGNEEQFLLVSRLDNLGKGASGAAVQNMNIMLGLQENLGL